MLLSGLCERGDTYCKRGKQFEQVSDERKRRAVLNEERIFKADKRLSGKHIEVQLIGEHQKECYQAEDYGSCYEYVGKRKCFFLLSRLFYISFFLFMNSPIKIAAPIYIAKRTIPVVNTFWSLTDAVKLEYKESTQ